MKLKHLLRLLMVAGALTLGGLTAATNAVAIPFHITPASDTGLKTPPTTDECLQLLGIHCYQPSQLEQAYRLNPLHRARIDGRGKTIVIVDSFGSPTISNDLKVFDKAFGLPDPPRLTVRQDAGPVPAFDPTNSDMVGWAKETTLDVEWSHVFAPGARILIEETPVSETEGVTGFPEIVQAENYVINHNLGDVISQSFGATEQTFSDAQSLLDLRSAFKNAARHDVTVLGSSGDTGAAGYELNGTDLYPLPVTSWPSTDPLVTSVGGTMLDLDASGNRLAPDVVWNDFLSAGGGAGGGGLSSIFDRPAFQRREASVVDGWRGIPDISMSAAHDGSVVYYWSFLPQSAGYHVVGGTSEASPEFAGIVAMADQLAGYRLGRINREMYRIDSGRGGIVDVTQGNNTYGPFTNSDGHSYTVQGYNAGPGYDLASGLGTVDAARFVPALAFWGRF